MNKITEKTELSIRSMARSNLLSKTEKDYRTGCLYWKGSRDKHGHGICHFNMKSKRVHRILMLLMGNDISGKNVAHCCGRPDCCNPDHLIFVGKSSSSSATGQKIKSPLYGGFRYRVSTDRVRSARDSGR